MLRRYFIGVRCSEDELKFLRARALECGLPVSTFLRTVGLGVTPARRRNALTQDAIHQLSRAGNNLNQIARRLNSNQPVPHGEITESLRRLWAAFDRIR